MIQETVVDIIWLQSYLLIQPTVFSLCFTLYLSFDIILVCLYSLEI